MENIIAHLFGGVVSSNSGEAHALYEKSRFGEINRDKIQYTLSETLFLVEKGKLDVLLEGKKTKLSTQELLKKFKVLDKRIQLKYAVYRDLREKGYIVKTALKFGADFRVYDKGIKPGKDHAKWILYVANETEKLTWQEFSAKNRIAHSTKKNLLIAVVDEEGDLTYYEVAWKRP